jgi:AraC-like DNA-binding protein
MAQVKQNLSKLNLSRTGGGVVFGDVTYTPGGTFGPRVQQDWQLVLLYEGEARVRVGQTTIDVPEQSVVLLQPGQLEQFAFAKHTETHHRWCAVHPSAVPETMQGQIQHANTVLSLSSSLHHLVELGLTTMNPESDESLSYYHGLMRNLGLAALQQYLLEAQMLGHRDRVPRALARAQRFIETHLAEPIRAADVAKAVHVTPQHLTKLFQQHLSTTPAKYLWQARADRGAELLRSTGLSVSDIADRCGFQNPFHFSRVIKNSYGHSPKAFRAETWATIKR